MRSIFARIVILGAVALAGCSGATPASKWNASIIAPAQESASGPEAKEAPVALEVKNAFVTGGILHVNVVLEAKTEIASDSVVVYVRGLKEGQTVSEQFRRASDSAKEPVLAEGARVAFSFELEAAKISEYQAACSWGDEALALLKNIEGTAVAAADPDNSPSSSVPATTTAVATSTSPPRETPEDGVKLSQVFIDSKPIDCATPPCDVLYSLRTDLLNDSPFLVSGVRLALSINWANTGEAPVLPEPGSDLLPNEDEIQLGDVVLAPGESKQIRLNVDKPLPVLEFGSFIPHLRLVDYQRDRAG